MGSKNKKIKSNNKDKKKKNKDNLNTNHSAPGDNEVTRDARFARVHTDPRYQEAPKRKTKVSIDSRFDRMYTDKNFLPSSAPIDKRGKRKDYQVSELGSTRHYHKTDEKEVEQSSDEEEEKVKGEKGVKLEETSESESATESEKTSESESASESEENSESDSAIDTETDTDEGGAVEEIYEEEAPDMLEDVPEIEKETYRLAVVNMDWRYVKAVDLYVLFSSSDLPNNGLIKSVAIYPSEFGLQRMKEEEVHGPIGLFDDENGKSEESASDDDIDNEKLREYEKSRMRYYYAVVECDSSATADYIYKFYDGVEFMHSSNAIDLRFILDNMEFKHPPRDVATKAPSNYEGKDFYSRALQHSKVNLSWDEDEPLREKTLKRKFTDEQIAELELKEFLTSDESESDDGENNNETDDHPDKKARKQKKYRALLQSGDDSDRDDEHDNVQDMEVTFNTGLEDISKHIKEKKDKKSETVWDATLRKIREKKKDGKKKAKHASSDDYSDDSDQEATEEDDFFIEEPTVKKRKKTQNKNNREHKLPDIDEGDKASKEELELLLAEDMATDTGLKGYNLKFKKGKGKRREKTIDEEKIPTAAFDDPRFAALFSPDYAMDPTNPQFKRSAAYLRQQAQKQQKANMDLLAEKELVNHKGMQLSSDDSGMKKGEAEGLDALKSKKDTHELSSLVKSIKMKSKQVQLPSGGKKKGGKSQIEGTGKKRH